MKEKGYVQPDRTAVLDFKDKLEKYGINATIRREMGRDMPEAFKIGYWLIIAWAVILLIHAAGLAFLPFLMELEYRVLWVVVPTVSLLWMTRYIFGDNLDWDKTDKKGWKEGRMNYSQKSNKKNIGR